MIIFRKNIFYFILFISIILGKHYEFSFSERENLINEILSIQNKSINEFNFIFPYIKKTDNKFYSIINNNNSTLHPILAFRYSNSSFELFPKYCQSDLLWFTPGLEFNYNKSYSLPFMANPLLHIQSYFRFNKHSAFGFNGDIVNKEQNPLMFPYNPKYSNELYYLSRSPKNGIDFDEGEGAIAIITPNIDFLLGKFRTKVGPFFTGNLSISNQAPGFSQVQIRAKSKNIIFTFIAGELYSDLFEEIDYSNPNFVSELEFPKKVRRYIVNHRLDIKIKENFRIGLYEQVIVGHHLPLLYLVPTMPFWSAQHALGDTDNLQMGFDVEYLGNNNRIYGAFLMDEWSPFNTFNSNHHNWFAAQLGYSYLLLNKFLLKFEYTRVEPQVYTHDDPINFPEHYNYPIGYWSGGDSEDILIKFFYKINNITDFSLNIRHTIMGNPIYSYESTEFLDSSNLKKRSTIGISINKIVDSFYGPLICLFELENIKSDNIYDKDSFINSQFSILYNINN